MVCTPRLQCIKATQPHRLSADLLKQKLIRPSFTRKYVKRIAAEKRMSHGCRIAKKGNFQIPFCSSHLWDRRDDKTAFALFGSSWWPTYLYDLASYIIKDPPMEFFCWVRTASQNLTYEVWTGNNLRPTVFFFTVVYIFALDYREWRLIVYDIIVRANGLRINCGIWTMAR